MDKADGQKIAKQISRKTGKHVTFIEFDGVLIHFQIEQRKLLKCIDINGKVTQEPKIVDNLFAPRSLPVYSITTCIPEQVENGDLEFMVNHGLSYDPKDDLRNQD